jgi:hypothetical protein
MRAGAKQKAAARRDIKKVAAAEKRKPRDCASSNVQHQIRDCEVVLWINVSGQGGKRAVRHAHSHGGHVLKRVRQGK